MKKDTKAWAIKLRGRSFYQGTNSIPFVYTTHKEAKEVAATVDFWKEIKAEAVRVKVRIEEI